MTELHDTLFRSTVKVLMELQEHSIQAAHPGMDVVAGIGQAAYRLRGRVTRDTPYDHTHAKRTGIDGEDPITPGGAYCGSGEFRGFPEGKIKNPEYGHRQGISGFSGGRSGSLVGRVEPAQRGYVRR